MRFILLFLLLVIVNVSQCYDVDFGSGCGSMSVNGQGYAFTSTIITTTTLKCTAATGSYYETNDFVAYEVLQNSKTQQWAIGFFNGTQCVKENLVGITVAVDQSECGLTFFQLGSNDITGFVVDPKSPDTTTTTTGKKHDGDKGGNGAKIGVAVGVSLGAIIIIAIIVFIVVKRKRSGEYTSLVR